MGHTRGLDRALQRTFCYVDFARSCEGHVSNGGDNCGPRGRVVVEDEGLLLEKYCLAIEHPNDHEEHQVSDNTIP
jgi:hypothetical protein